MIALFAGLFARRAPAVSEAGARDAAAIAALHAESFRRGWSEEEVESLLLDGQVVAHRALIGMRMAGFVISRRAADEAEILSIAVASARRGRGIARQLLDLHLRRLAGAGTKFVFLEVDEHNAPARKLYAHCGFREVGRRANYYPTGDGRAAAALTLRRDLA